MCSFREPICGILSAWSDGSQICSRDTGTGFFLSRHQKKQIVDFIGRYENAFQVKPKFIEAVAYDTGMMLFQTVSYAEIKSRKELNDRIHTIRNYDGE